MNADQPLKPSEVILHLISHLLAPLFFEAAGNRYDFARAAALQTVLEYRARSGGEFLLGAQIVAFSLASLSTLLQSMNEGVPLDAAIRLQAKAGSLTRTAETCRKALNESLRKPLPSIPRQPDEQPSAMEDPAVKSSALEERPVNMLNQPAPATPAVAAAETAPDSADQSRDMWANSFAVVAEEIAAKLPGLTEHERHVAAAQMSALNNAAGAFRTAPPHHAGSAN